MSEGPTTVGSIVGKLKMDRGQWVAMMAATKADVRELENLDPDIHIDTNAAEVVTKIGAAKKATETLGDAQDELGRKTIKANDANKTSVTRIGAIVTAIALLVPLLAPVGAAAIGVGTAFLGMGAAGVLAIIGINRAMDDGTELGTQYRAGIDSLKGSMNTLAQTAAVNMLSSFQRIARETAAAMPQLNTQVGQFSGLLGRSGANLFTGTINSLRILNPLFMTAGVYLETLTEGFQRWTQSGGIEQFGGYALSMLPMVTELLGKLASTVMHILQALAPLGTIGMAALIGISDAISAIPVEILSQLIVTITWGAIAFKAWGFVAPMLATLATNMGMVGAATTIATGPIGWVVAGLAALAGIFAVTIASNTGATRAMQDYTAAVQSDTGAIKENVRAKAGQKLLDDGAYDSAKRLGISTQIVTEATLGNTAAQKKLAEALEVGANGSKRQKEQLDGTGLSLVEYGLAVQTVKQSVESNSVAIEGEIGRYKTLQDALVNTTTATRAQQHADEATAAALGISAGALAAARAGQTDMQAATEKATAEMYLQNDAAGLLQQALDGLNGKTLNAEEAQNRFDSSLANMGAHIDKTGADVERATASLQGMSAAAVANRGELISSVNSAQASAQAFRDQGGSAEDTRQKLIDMKAAIVEQAVAVGENREEVQAYIDKLFQIPETLPPTKLEVDTGKAMSSLAQFVADASRKVITIGVTTYSKDGPQGALRISNPGQPDMYALGGTTRGLAAGGTGGTVVGRGTPGSDNAGVYRLGNGEEVISNVFGQADRSRALLKGINAGYTPSQITGSGAQGSAVAAAPQQTIVHLSLQVTTVQNEDPRILGRIIGREVTDALAGVNS